MSFSKKMQSLAFFTFLACVAIAVPTEKKSVCCKEVSSKKINVPVTGFKVQPPRPPCVKAVIFYTSEGAVCSHWREEWVRNKVLELRKLQTSKTQKTMATTKTPAFQTANITANFNTTLRD